MYQARDKSIFYNHIIQKANTTLLLYSDKEVLWPFTYNRTISFLFLTFKYWYNISEEFFSCLKSDSSWNEFAGTGGRTVVINWAGILSTSIEIFSLKDWHTSCFKLTWGLKYFRGISQTIEKNHTSKEISIAILKFLTRSILYYILTFWK